MLGSTARFERGSRSRRDGGADDMITGKMVRVRLKRYFVEQRQWVLIGRVQDSTESWLTIEGKAIVISKGHAQPIDIDQDVRVLMVPRENIAQMRILPDDFDMSVIVTEIKGARVFVKVKDAPDTAIGEYGGE